MAYLVFVLLVGLAAANGANDVSKGVATLAGAGVTRYRTAILWGTATTLLGGLLALWLGRSMGKLFSTGIVDAPPTPGLALAVLTGAASWVALATVFRLPVSTTHAIVGSLIGAGLLLDADSVQWAALLPRVVAPLLLSIAAAYALSYLLYGIATMASKLRPAADKSGPQQVHEPVGASTSVATATRPVLEVRTASASGVGQRLLSACHWMSSGATGAARGLNDTPKIAAIGGFALIPAGWSGTQVVLVVVAAMAAGSLLGLPVAKTLGEKVVRMSHSEGMRANLVTACLVGFGAGMGLPMSTTHTSTGAIVGAPGPNLSRLNRRTLRDFLIAWTITPVAAASVAALVQLIAG